MTTITGRAVTCGDRVLQVAEIGLAMLPTPVVVLGVDEDHHGIILGKDLQGPPLTDLSGAVRLYPSEKFMITN